VSREVASWGRHPHLPPARVLAIVDREAPLPQAPAPMLPYGNGRSYGDSCQNLGGTVLDARGLDRFMAFDAGTGVLRCEAGILFDDILRLAVPRGWFLPVAPGTRFVTVGGAIANDVHGKNHVRVGSLGRHVLGFELLRSDGARLHCTPSAHADLFAATIGGLGLTGLISWADLQLVPVAGPWLAVERQRFGRLDDFFALSRESAASFEHTVAWIDCLAPAGQRGRGIFSRANVAAEPGDGPRRAGALLSVPFTPPFPVLGGPGLRGFNRLYYHRPRRRHARQHYQPFFFPLDGIADWNRLYGPQGFVQHQCVLPPDAAPGALVDVLDGIADSGTGSFLAVLKTFGDLPSPGLMSFPRAGTTLALDFPWRGDDTARLLDRLDAIVAAAGGAVYPAKDARMSGAHFRRFFPNWETFARHIDPAFSSSFWRRVMAEAT
jgi:FAD/FMN-containing dehydrogenase